LDSSERRQAILEVLGSRGEIIKGSDLAAMFNVSRQVIVQDIALLRARGKDIFATPRGYTVMMENSGKDIQKTIVTRHFEERDIEEELNIIVDNGGTIQDVIVEHPVYGEIRGNLMISTRHDVSEFMAKLESEKAEPLCSLTEGIHLHTLKVPDEKAYKRIVLELERKGYLPASD